MGLIDTLTQWGPSLSLSSSCSLLTSAASSISIAAAIFRGSALNEHDYLLSCWHEI